MDHRLAWTDAVYFIPFVGQEYERGLTQGVRVLLLGESHYASAPKAREWGRKCTIENFKDYENESCDFDSESPFFRKLPRIVTRKLRPTQSESALAWRRIAYANRVQRFVGEHARERPSPAQWGTGDPALVELTERLKPHVILVLGAENWNKIKWGSYADETIDPPIFAPRKKRRIWLVPHSEGYAKCTWVYHPSTNCDSVQSAIDVFSQLIERGLRNRDQSNSA